MVVMAISVTAPTPAGASPAPAPRPSGSTAAAGVPTEVATGGAFHAVAPARVFDTRDGTNAPGGVAGPLGPGASVDVPVLGQGGVPASGVAAVVLEVTATQPSADTHLTLFPTGGSVPDTSNLNLRAGTTVPNLVEVAVGTGGKVSVRNNSGTTHVIFDVAGWVDDVHTTTGVEGLFHPLSPVRILDTRESAGGTTIGPDATLDVQVTGEGGVPTTGVSAVVLNLTVVNPTAPSFLAAFPAGSAWPGNSSSNFLAGQVVPSRVVVPIGTDGKVSLYNSKGTVDVIADVNGWYSDASDAADVGAVFTGLPSPTRVFDSRDGAGTPVAGGSSVAVPVAGHGGVPAQSGSTPPTAVVANITITQPTAETFLTGFPAGTNKPLASDLNAKSGVTRANLAVLRLGEDGAVKVFNNSGAAHVIVDVFGYYQGDVRQAAGLIVLDSTSRAAISSVDATHIHFGSSPAQVAGLVVGNTVVSKDAPNAPDGLLRKVEAIAPDGSGGVIVTTSAADLTDALDAGRLTTSVPLDADSIPAQPAGAGTSTSVPAGGAPQAQVLGRKYPLDFSESAGPFTLEAHAKFAGTVDLDVAWANPATHELKSATLSAKLSEDFSASLEGKAKATLNKDVTLIDTTLQRITVYLGAVPVVIDPRFASHLLAHGQIEGQAKAAMTQHAAVTEGVTYDPGTGEFQERQVTEQADPQLTTLTASAQMAAKVQVTVVPAVTLYGVATIGVGIDPYARIDMPDSCSKITLYGGVDVHAQLHVAILSKVLADKAVVGNLYETKLGDYDPAVCYWTGFVGIRNVGYGQADTTYTFEEVWSLTEKGQSLPGVSRSKGTVTGNWHYVVDSPGCSLIDLTNDVSSPQPIQVIATQVTEPGVEQSTFSPSAEGFPLPWTATLVPTGQYRLEVEPGVCEDHPIPPTPFPLPAIGFEQAGNTLSGSYDSDTGSEHAVITYRLTRMPDTDKDGIPNDADATPASPDPFSY